MNNLLSQMLSKLTGAYASEPDSRIGKLFSIYADAVYSAESALNIIAMWRSIDNARGTTLDRIGRNFGVRRDGADDRFYRLLIKVKMIALLSGGDIDTMLNAAAALFEVPVETVELAEVFPAKVWIYIDGDILDEERTATTDLIALMMKRIAAAGVGVKIFIRFKRGYIAPLILSQAALVRQHVTVHQAPIRRTYGQILTVGAYGAVAQRVTIRPARPY